MHTCLMVSLVQLLSSKGAYFEAPFRLPEVNVPAYETNPGQQNCQFLQQSLVNFCNSSVANRCSSTKLQFYMVPRLEFRMSRDVV